MIVLETSIPGMQPKRGKVRDVYDFGDSLLLVSSDRISAFDWILPTPIPDKGRILTEMSVFWFQTLGVKNHLITTDLTQMPFPKGTDLDMFAGRSILCKKGKVVPIECIVRGYLSGSGWNEYKKSGTVCGLKLPEGLTESASIPLPIFTPSTKAESGHDENISFEQMIEILDRETSEKLRDMSIDIFRRGSEYAKTRGIIIADTKFEFGWVDGELILIDEVLTPDSSRFWPADQYTPGRSQPSFDKQFVRDWLTATSWDKNSPPPELPGEIVEKTRLKYIEAFEIITQKKFDAK
ncbi:MAG: phosphoribosylaminoimidazolesuccinocarboxamide synthase [Thermoguttaceae bacterium]